MFDYSGLGGWLALVQIGLYYSLIQLFRDTMPVFAPETWNVLTSKESELYHPLWGPLLTFELVYNIVFYCLLCLS
ncbi:DUF2569 family protein [Paenibacillus glacialis]|uniref:DUF2569 family protein n=1 Tax=Paenibacillus glacialis TaxID=494026 RepID=UPI0009FD46B3